MSSIRSLATITLLAGVGIFLYLKINEVPPILPAEVEGLQLGELGDIQFGEQPSTPSATPQFGATLPGDAVPAFNPSRSPTASTAQAPAWNDSQANSSPNALAPPPIDTPTNEAPAFGEPVAANISAASVPDLPPLPTLPPPAPAATSLEGMSAESGSSTKHEHDGHDHNHAEHDHGSETAAAHKPSVPPAIAGTTLQPPAGGAATGQSSLFSATRLAVEAALDRGELSQALLLLSDWYDDPSLTASESKEVNDLLRQLAGTVIYSTEHRLEPPYMVQAGEQLEDIARKYQVPWQLLAKINGISSAGQLQPGQQLKVVRGPFSALIDLGRRKMTLMLDRRYAGQFSLEVDPSNSVEAGHWTVNQKLLTPGNVGSFGSSAGVTTEEQSLMLSSPDGSTNQLTILRGSNATTPTASEPVGRVIRLGSQEVGDVYDILSLGSPVVIRR